MARIPVQINSRSEKPREVTAVFYVDGKEYTQVTSTMPEFAIPHVIAAAYAQVEDPDVDGAVENARTSGDPLPRGY